MNRQTQEELDKLRHSTAHLLAAAVLDLYPNAKLAIGPSIENGFYYDIDFGKTKITEGDLLSIEKKMREILPTWSGFEKHEVSKKDALKEYEKNDYKKELISEFSQAGKELTIYQSGKFRDLCRGGHVDNPSQDIGAFKLLSLAGAYWRGDEKNPMLTRIYGTAFPSQKELDDYLDLLEEAKKRDHKKLGRELELFMFHETSPGMPYWLPKGWVLYTELLNFWREEHKKRGYLETATPLLNKKELYETSGHWSHYKDDMFIAEMGEGEIYGIKPMNCPNAMVLFGSKTRSYKDLPLRFSDADRLHRYELSGTLNGLLRIRSFQQDDSHNFITEDMIEDEYNSIFDICRLFYGIFGLNYSFRLGTRPEKFIGDPKTWSKAEKALENILKKSGVEYSILEGDGAFYGPKVDITMKDALGREWQMGTIQLDFVQPSRFKLKYIDKDGSEKTPVVVHRVIYGSIERFIGILIENFAGAFPVWLAPEQVRVLPITDRNLKYAEKIKQELQEHNIRVSVDEESETLGNKIRKAQELKVPYMIIVGDRDEKAEKISLRLRTGDDLGQVDLKDALNRIKEKTTYKALDL